MSQPVTSLDPRFSQEDAVATTWAHAEAVLEQAQLFWITTVRRDGRPHVTPLVGVWGEGALHFCTGSAEQKTLNLQGNPHVVLATGSISWESGLDVVVEGDAVRVDDDERLGRLAELWSLKWDGRWNYDVRDGAFWHPEGWEDTPSPVLVFAVKPTKVLSFSEGSFSQTRHLFG
ncbi:MAG: pyridoxamine 5'-phosphate oxidase family protein [Acidimicrobiales bacterium]|jgi:nitroimidazol reductase NimA-like FMN-containing flavoprotein (pyridoxamine 5'-phosphate oxidase superfamily)